MTPLLSIIIPLFNTEKYIAGCLDSVLACRAELGQYEIIVVDDGSTDASASIVRSYVDRFSQVRLISQKNQGVSLARKTGASQAQGAFIWFIDSDDYLTPGAVDQLLSTMKDNPETDTFIAPVIMKDEDSGNEWIKPFAQPEERILSGRSYLREKPVSVCPVQFVFRRCLLENEWVFFPEGLRHEDEYFCRVLQYFSPSILLVGQPLYVYRQWKGSFMNSSSLRSVNDMVEVYKYMVCFIEKGARPEDGDWLRPDAFSFLMGTHFWHLDQLNTKAFRNFRKTHLSFLRQEFKKNAKYFPFKERVLDGVALYAPSALTFLMRLKSKLR